MFEDGWPGDAGPSEPERVFDDTPVDPLADAVDWARKRNVSDGQIALAVLDLLASTSRHEALSPRVLVAAEVGPALGLGSGAATKLVDTVMALNSRLRLTFAAVVRGDLEWHKAVMLAEATAPLTDAHAREVEQRVMANATGRTPAQHADAVRRAVARVDPAGAESRRRRARADVTLIRAHYGDGMGELFARMASEQLDTVYSAADLWARSRKADGDARTVDQLRVAALVQWAQSFLRHGDPAYCDRWCTPGSHEPPPTPTAAPTRHGRAGALTAIWDLQSLLGLESRCGELADSGAVLPPEAMRELVTGGVAIRRMVVDDATGELLDLTPRSWTLPRTAATELDAPVTLSVILTLGEWEAIRAGDADPALLAAIDAAPAPVRDMLAHPWTAADLDRTAAAYPTPARVAEFVGVRDRHPVSPTAGPTAAAAADIDHTISVRDGGSTTVDNLASLTRRWHRLKTHGGWTVRRNGRRWEWTSPRGHTYATEPYDYRLGP